MKAEEIRANGMYRLNAVIPAVLGKKLDELSKGNMLNLTKKGIVTAALMEYIDKQERALAALKK